MDLKVFTNNIEDSAKEQIDILMQQEAFKNAKVRIMPDVHSGKGCVIGFTAEFKDKIIPNIVGVDIGCGVICIALGKMDIDYKKLDDFIKEKIPSGMNIHNLMDNRLATVHVRYVAYLITKLRCYQNLRNLDRIEKSIGTLGGGNHFIEIDVDDKGNKYLIVHTGSRNLGKQVAEIYQQKAIDRFYKTKVKDKIDATIEELKAQGREKEIESAIKDIKEHYVATNIPKELCYLEGQDAQDYLHDMHLCQEYARYNRKLIAEHIRTALQMWNCYYMPNETFESVHNYIDLEHNIIRKGAISAYKNEKVIIPLNMKDGCILGIGKGNDDWNNSAPHGAGRLMSRNEARRDLKLDDFKKAMNGIYTTTADETTIDESPMAYKNAKEIIDAISDTVEIVAILKPVYNFKASDLEPKRNIETHHKIVYTNDGGNKDE